MSDYQKLAMPFIVEKGGGLDIRTVADLLPRGSYRRFTNVEEALNQHAPCTRRASLYYAGHSVNYGAPVHSAIVGRGSVYLVGAGHNLYDQTTGAVVDTGYSGNPLSFVEYREPGNSIPWVIIGDSQKMSKAALINGHLTIYKLGISPPGAVPPFVGSGAPVVSTVNGSGTLDSSTGVGYDWRQTYYSTVTQAESNPSAIQAATLSVVNQSVDLVPGAASADPQVNAIRFWRRGGTLGDTWRLIGQQANIGGASSGTAILSILASPNGLASVTDINIYTLSQVGSTVSITLVVPPWGQLKVGDQITVQGVSVAGYNGAFTVTNVPGGNVIQVGNSSPGLPPVSSSGTVSFQLFNCIAPGTLPSPLPANLTIAGASDTTYNGTWNIRLVQTFADGRHFTLAGNFYHEPPSGGGTATLVGLGTGGFQVTGATWASGTVTLTVSPDSGMLVGQYIHVSGVSPSGYNGVYQITAVGPGTLSYALVSNPGAFTTVGSLVFNDNNSDVSIASNPVLSLDNDVPVTTVDLQNRTIYEQPLASIWGPYTGGSLFGCRDPNQPGFIDWSNPFAVDGWSSLNNVEVSPPADALQNGFVWQGRNWTFSSRLLWEVFPLVIGSTTGYQAYDAGAGHGLADPWAFAAGPDTPRVWYRTQASGVVEFGGGGPAVSITEEKLGDLFLASNFAVVPPPQFENLFPCQIFGTRMRFADNEMRMSYLDSNGQGQVLCYEIYKRTWRHATYPYQISCFYFQPNVGVLIMGGSDGGLYVESGSFGGGDQSVSSSSIPITCDLRTGYVFDPDPQTDKQYGDVVCDYLSNGAPVTFTALYANDTLPRVTATIANGAVRGQTPIDLQDVYAVNWAADFTWSSIQLVQLFQIELLYKVDVVPVTHMHSDMSAWGIEGYFHVSPDSYVTYRSTAPVTVKCTNDSGQTWTITLPSTGGAKEKVHLSDGLIPNKELLVEVDVDSAAPFRIYEKDSFLSLQPWNGVQPVDAQVFGV
jgi:hypothetical protein